jgi:hypothetical protein
VRDGFSVLLLDLGEVGGAISSGRRHEVIVMTGRGA